MKKDTHTLYRSWQRSSPGVVRFLAQLLRRQYRPSVRLASFGAVGATGLVVNTLLLASLTDLVGLHYLLSAILATQGSTLWNFWLCETWVFKDRDTHRPRLGRFVPFLLMNNLAFGLRGPVLMLLTSGLGLHYLISNVIAILLLGVLRYILSDRFIWINLRPHAGSLVYDIHGLLRIQSQVRLPELEHFRVQADGQVQDMRVVVEAPRSQDGVEPAEAAGSPRLIRYSQGLGPLGFRVQVLLGGAIEVRVSPLLAASPHVLYTNVVEPLLRWMFVRKGYALVHGACIATGGQAVLISAQTDTGKTTTVLRTLAHYPLAFLSDDMTILSRDGRVLCYPKPLTISHHTVEAVDGAGLSPWQQIALRLQSRVHSRAGRRIALALAKTRLPMASINACIQIMIPPPKYRIQRLIQGVKLAQEARLSHLVFIERGPEAEEPLERHQALEMLLRNCEDAYGFPPYTELAGALLRSYDEDLRQAESDIIAAAIAGCPALVLRRENRNWWEGLFAACNGLSAGIAEDAAPLRGAFALRD